MLWPQGRFVDAQNYKIVFPNVYDFCKSLNARKIFLVNLRTFFDIVLYCTMLKYKMGAKNHKSIVLYIYILSILILSILFYILLFIFDPFYTAHLQLPSPSNWPYPFLSVVPFSFFQYLLKSVTFISFYLDPFSIQSNPTISPILQVLWTGLPLTS